MTVRDIEALVKAIDPAARHYASTDDHEDAYTIWYELRMLPFMGDGKHMGGIAFHIDRFTRFEADAMASAIYAGLEARDDVAFEYLVDYESDTGYIHHIFSCQGV